VAVHSEAAAVVVAAADILQTKGRASRIEISWRQRWLSQSNALSPRRKTMKFQPKKKETKRKTMNNHYFQLLTFLY